MIVRHDQRMLFCKSESERDEWVSLLQRAAAVVPIEDDYVIGKDLTIVPFLNHLSLFLFDISS